MFLTTVKSNLYIQNCHDDSQPVLHTYSGSRNADIRRCPCEIVQSLHVSLAYEADTPRSG